MGDKIKSDHCPIIVNIKKKKERKRAETEGKGRVEKGNWSKEGISRKVKRRTRGERVEEKWKNMREKIKETLERVEEENKKVKRG